ncbi:MAG: PilZ domain-containing protein [SAR324 cluster bacterium]|nr:PilZ domain-containing protein [SAR324 cluster bacterium]
MGEHRQFSRVDFGTKIRIYFKGQHLDAQLLDISLKGALIEIKKRFDIHLRDILNLEFELGGSDVTLEIETELVHLNENLLGLKFKAMDVESLTHLRRLMELNIGDSDQVGRELEFLSGQ